MRGLFTKTKHALRCSRCGVDFKSDFKPTPGIVHNCKGCDEQILLGKIAKAKDKSEKKQLLNALIVVRNRDS